MPKKYDGAQKPFNPYTELGGILFHDALDKSFNSAMSQCDRPYDYHVRSGHWEPMLNNKVKWTWDEPAD